MVTTASVSEVARLIGEPARAAMLQILMDGRALTAGELARAAGIAPQTASAHLERLVGGGLLAVVRQGRHRYHRLATPAVGHLLETIMQLAAERPQPSRRITTGPRDRELRRARLCYDHLAGGLGVALCDRLVDQGHAVLSSEAGEITDTGLAFLDQIGIDLVCLVPAGVGSTRPLLCRPCLDWSERRAHLAGRVGQLLCRHAIERGWLRRRDLTRAIEITRAGEQAFRAHFAIDTTQL